MRHRIVAGQVNVLPPSQSERAKGTWPAGGFPHRPAARPNPWWGERRSFPEVMPDPEPHR